MPEDPHANSLTERVPEIISEALEIESEDRRRAYVDEACGGDQPLHEMVNRLLGHHSAAEHFFQDAGPTCISAAEISQTLADIPEFFENMTDALPDDNEIGKEIGNYKLLQKIGEGGGGNVYLAQQEKPVRRQVALKIIKLGMNTENVIARFEAERQMLALMDHPNIARVITAGATEEGRPYFAMDLVPGTWMTTYCDKNKLGIAKRLKLFIQVCYGIHHAHQKGIIHQDIKPANVIITEVDGVPVPKVIDFGIAKAIAGQLLPDRSEFTACEQFVGTPAYMSPEQADINATDVDVRSDIYSLGVLLYQLLTGSPPFDKKMLMRSGLEEMRRIIREQEPPRPSERLAGLSPEDLAKIAEYRHIHQHHLIELLHRDLDWIVMKAIDKDRDRRYQSADGFADDIQRYLHHEPVVARPPNRLYRLRKLVHRNKGVFLSITAVSVALIVGLGTSSWLLVKEREARKRAVLAEQQQSRLRLEAEDRERIAHAAFLLNQNKVQEADQIVAEITSELKPSLEAETVLRRLGEWHALKGEWPQAAKLFSALLKVDEMDNSWAITGDLLMAGPILIEHGNIEGYEQFRKVAIDRYSGTDDPIFAERTIKISLLLPAEEQVMNELQPLYKVASDGTQGPVNKNGIMESWRAVSLALMAYRQESYSTAISWCERSLACVQDNPARVATAQIIKAMAHQHLDENESAKSELAKGREIIDAAFDQGLQMGTGMYGFWYDWLFARILLREAAELIDSSAPTTQ